MLIFFSSFLLSLKNDFSFRGRCTILGNSPMKLTLMTNSTQFFLTITGAKLNEFNNNSYRSIFELYQNNQIDIESRYELFGVRYNKEQQNSYIFFRDTAHNRLKGAIEYLTNLTKNGSFTNMNDIFNYIINHNISPHVLSITMNDQSITDHKKYFLDMGMKGNFNIRNITTILLDGQQVNMITFISDGKIFGFFLCICILLDFYAWYWVIRVYNTRSLLQHFSVHSLILHLGYNFGLLFFTLDIAVSIDHLTKFFMLIFLFMIFGFFFFQIPLLADVWRGNEDIFARDDADIHEIQYRMLMLFLELSIEIIFASVLTTYMFDYPVICSLFQILAFIPQIWHLIRNPLIIKADYIFITNIYIIRLMPIYYFTIISNNFLLIDGSKSFGIFLMSFWTLQYIILLLQNTFGGDFFLPEASRMPGYDYSTTRDMNPEHDECPICMTHIEETDETMTPPCGHTFHRNCLLRWMEEDRICPVCRAQLPIEARD